MTIANRASCLALCLTGVHFRGELQHVGHVGRQKIKCRPIRTRGSGVRLQDELYEADHIPEGCLPQILHCPSLNTLSRI